MAVDEIEEKLKVLLNEVMKKHMSLDTISQVINLYLLPYVTIEYIDSLIDKFPNISEFELRKNISDMLRKNN